jgi:hypothetical protein
MDMQRFAIRSTRALALVAIGALLSGCGDSTSEPEGTSIQDLVGSWKASSALFTNQANPSQQFDVVGAGGEIRMTILEGGRARTWVELGDFSDEWDALFTISGNQLTSTPAEAARPPRQYTFELQGDRLTISRSDAQFDFTLEGGNEVSATEVFVYQRQ